MANYANEDLLNELSRIFRGNVEPLKDGGVVDPIAVHGQVIEIARAVLLLNPGGIFYLARLIRSALLRLVQQEIALIEDMLIALDDLQGGVRHDGTIIGNVGPQELANGMTALLALEAASGRDGSIAGRPELERFTRIMDQFAGHTRQNVVNLIGNYSLPRGEARSILSENFASLQVVHPKLLAVSDNVRNLVEEYNDLDVPSQVSQTALVNIRRQLAELQATIEQSTNEELITDSRVILLRALAAKVVVALLQQFNVLDLGQARLTSNNTGTGATDQGPGPFLARAAGEGTPASVLTSSGPWVLDDLSEGTLELQIDAGPIQVFDLSQIQGPGIHGRNPAPFTDAQLYPVWPGPGLSSDPPPPPEEDYFDKPNLHIIVDSNTYEFTSQEWGYINIAGTFFGPTGAPPQPPAPDNAPPPANLIDSPRVYPVGGIIGNLTGTPGDLISDYYNTVRMQPPVKLGFKHLGCLVYFTLGEVPDSSGFGVAQKGAGFGGWNVDGQDTTEDQGEWSNVRDRRWPYLLKPRTIYELTEIAALNLTHVSGNLYSVTATPADPDWVGFYVRTGTTPGTWERYEIIEVLTGGTQVIIDTRNDAAGSAAGVVPVFGQRGDYSQVTFFPDLLSDTHDVADLTGTSDRGPFSVPNTCTITVSPAIKTAAIPAGDGGTIANAVAALSDPTNADVDYPDNRYQAASYHCIFREQSGFNGRITVQNRSRHLPDELGISVQFFKSYMFLPAQNPAGTRFEIFPGPLDVELIRASAHEVLGFVTAEKADPTLDPFLSVEELETLINDTVDTDTTLIELVEETVFAGLLSTIENTFTVQDLIADFTQLGVGLGFMLEIEEGDAAAQYIIRSSTGSVLTLQRNTEKHGTTGFVGREVNLSYRIFTQRLRISSKNAEAGSSVLVTTAPTSFSLPTTLQVGTTPAIEAVNANGDNLDLSSLEPGDTSGSMVVESVSGDGTQATIVGGVASSTVGLTFSFESAASGRLQTLVDNVNTILISRSLLAQNNFSTNLNKLDAALSSLVTPGLSFQANINQVRLLLADLLSCLTQTPRLSALYSATIPIKTPAMEQTLTTYTAERVAAVDALLDALQDYGFDRALTLLIGGDLQEFFNTTPETASFAGALMAAARQAASDVPQPGGILQSAVESELNTSTSTRDETDADVDFSDTDGQQQDQL